MHRIDSINARPDVNGAGKKGFHDNADLPGQDATYLTPRWLNTFQEELCNLLELNGVALEPDNNKQLFGLLATIAQVEQAITEAIEAIPAITQREDIGVGDLFITAQDFADSAAVAAHKGYGTWERFGNGHALVAMAHDATNAPSWMQNIGYTGGEYEHQLTVAQLPRHKLPIRLAHEDGGSQDKVGFPAVNHSGYVTHSADNEDFSETNGLGDGNPLGSVGNDEPFNIVQPSIIVGVWKRTA